MERDLSKEQRIECVCGQSMLARNLRRHQLNSCRLGDQASGDARLTDLGVSVAGRTADLVLTASPDVQRQEERNASSDDDAKDSDLSSDEGSISSADDDMEATSDSDINLPSLIDDEAAIPEDDDSDLEILQEEDCDDDLLKPYCFMPSNLGIKVVDRGLPIGAEDNIPWTRHRLLEIFKKHNVSDSCATDLIDFLNDLRYDHEDRPKSHKALSREELRCYPRPPRLQYTDPGTKQIVEFSSMRHLIGMLIYRYENRLVSRAERDVMAHPSDSDCWAYYASKWEKLKRIKDPPPTHLLNPVVFMDDYEQAKSRRKKVGGVYMTLANLPMSILESTTGKEVLTIAPTDVNVDTLMEVVFIQPLIMLENGTKIQVEYNRYIDACGSLYMMGGDHPGQGVVFGTAGPLRRYGDRYTDIALEELHLTSFDDPALAYRGRDPATVLRMFEEDDVNGLARMGVVRKSSLWKLGWLRKNFFRHAGLCYLHFALEGNYRRLTCFMFGRLPPNKELDELIISVNVAVAEFQKKCPYPMIRRLPHGLLRCITSRKTRRKELRLATYTGEMIDHWSQISPFILGQFDLNTNEVEVWMQRMLHMRAIRSLTVKKQDLPLLEAKIAKTMSETRDCYEDCIGKGKGNWFFAHEKAKRDALSAIKKSALAYLKKRQPHSAGFTFNLPNNWSETQAVKQIQFLGPLPFQDVSTFERLNLLNRNEARYSNQHNSIRDAFRKAVQRHACSYSRYHPPEQEHSPNDGTLAKKGDEKWLHIGGYCAYIASYLFILDERLFDKVSRVDAGATPAWGITGTIFLAQISDIIMPSPILPQGALNLVLYKCIDPEDALYYMPVYMPTHTDVLYRLDQPDMHLLAMPMVCPHPDRTERNRYCHNTFIYREIRCKDSLYSIIPLYRSTWLENWREELHQLQNPRRERRIPRLGTAT